MRIPESLSIVGDFLANLGESSLFTLNVKDISTQKYCMNNAVCADMWGLSDLCGMTTREVLGRVSNFTNLEEELVKSAELEEQVIKDARQGSRTQTAIVFDGTVHVRQLLVTPVIGLSQKPVALVTTAHDKTRQISLLRLFDLYKHYYFYKKEAIRAFSNYLQLDKYFIKYLRGEELRLLLVMTEDAQYKRAARSLNISTKTIGSYLSSIKDKLKPNLCIQDIFIALRRFYQWQPE